MNSDYEEKVKKYSTTVFRYAYSFLKNKHDAEDIMQEVFMKYLTKNPSFKDKNHEKAWFIRVTINMSKNYLKACWFKNREELPDNIIVKKEDENNDELWDAIYKLPEKYKITIIMYYIENYSINEISKILKRNPSTIGTWLERGKEKLKMFMEV